MGLSYLPNGRFNGQVESHSEHIGDVDDEPKLCQTNNIFFISLQWQIAIFTDVLNHILQSNIIVKKINDVTAHTVPNFSLQRSTYNKEDNQMQPEIDKSLQHGNPEFKFGVARPLRAVLVHTATWLSSTLPPWGPGQLRPLQWSADVYAKLNMIRLTSQNDWSQRIH